MKKQNNTYDKDKNKKPKKTRIGSGRGTKRKYKSYKQTNFNIYFEYMTNTVLNSDFPLKYDKFSYTIAPGIQFIIFSRSSIIIRNFSIFIIMLQIVC